MVANVGILGEREIIDVCVHRRAGVFVGDLALDPDPALDLKIDRHGSQTGRVGNERVDAHVRLVVSRHEADLVAGTFRQSGQAVSALGVGHGLDNVSTGDGVVCELVALDRHTRDRLPGVLVSNHSHHWLGWRGHVPEVASEVRDRSWLALEFPDDRSPRQRDHLEVLTGDTWPVYLHSNRSLVPDTAELESALGVRCGGEIAGPKRQCRPVRRRLSQMVRSSIPSNPAT